MSDLVERLRECQPPVLEDSEMCKQAADEIEQLTADCKDKDRLIESLRGDLEVMRLQRDAKKWTDGKDPVCDINGCMHQRHFTSIRKLQALIAELEETVKELEEDKYAPKKEAHSEIPDPPF